MDKIVILGGRKLKGEINVSGSKNAALPIMAAALLGEGTTQIEHVPNLKDVQTMIKLLRVLGAKANYSHGTVEIKMSGLIQPVAPYHVVSTMRASVCVLG